MEGHPLGIFDTVVSSHDVHVVIVRHPVLDVTFGATTEKSIINCTGTRNHFPWG